MNPRLRTIEMTAILLAYEATLRRGDVVVSPTSPTISEGPTEPPNLFVGPSIHEMIFDDPLARMPRAPKNKRQERCIERPHKRWPVRR